MHLHLAPSKTICFHKCYDIQIFFLTIAIHFRYDTNICASSIYICAKICFYNCCNEHIFAMVKLYVLLQVEVVEKNPLSQLLQSTPFRYGTNICASSICMCAKICFYNCCNKNIFAMVKLYVLLQVALV